MTRWRDTRPTRKRRDVVPLHATSTRVTNEWRGPASGAVKGQRRTATCAQNLTNGHYIRRRGDLSSCRPF